MESTQLSINLKYATRGEETIYSTLSVYKYIGVSSHQKMKEKANRLGIELLMDKELGSCLTKFNLLNLLRSYQSTLKGDRLNRVNLLVDYLTNVTTSFNQAVNPLGKMNGSKGRSLTSGFNRAQPKVNQGLPKVKWYEQGLNTLGHFIQVLSTFLKTEQFIFMVLAGALIIQVNHVANLFIRAAEVDGPLSWVSAYLYGAVAELTALLLTIRRGKQSILLTFGILTFWVNLLYYQVWLGYSASLEWFTLLMVKITLSAFLAFVIYSYTHLFTETIIKQ